MSCPLPPNDRRSSSERQAYTLVLGYEARCVDDVYLPRILGYFLRELPAGIDGPQNLAREILSCVGAQASAVDAALSLPDDELYGYNQADDTLSHLARSLRDNLLCPFQIRTPTPAPPEYESRDSSDDSVENLVQLTKTTAPDHRQAKILVRLPGIFNSTSPLPLTGRRTIQALARDNNRCLRTGKIDESMVPNELGDEINFLHGTIPCHIIPRGSISQTRNSDDAAARNKGNSKTQSVLGRLCLLPVFDELTVGNQHKLENILTLGANEHLGFIWLRWCFAPTEVENVYRIEPMRPNLGSPPYGRTVRFEDHSRLSIPLPESRYLALHRTCCRVAYLSGAREYLDELYRDLEYIRTLRSDGSSYDVLLSAMARQAIYA